MKNDVLECIQSVISELNGLELVVFYLKIERGLSIQDIGKRLGLSHEGIRKIYKKIIAKIKKDYEIHQSGKS